MADDGAKLFIDGRKVVDNDGNHPVQTKSGTIALDQGSYKLRVEWYQGPRNRIALQLHRAKWGGGEEIVGENDFLNDGSNSNSCELGDDDHRFRRHLRRMIRHYRRDIIRHFDGDDCDREGHGEHDRD
jgi:hypothetical protein